MTAIDIPTYTQFEEAVEATKRDRPSFWYKAGSPQRYPDELDRYQLQFHKSAHTVRMMVLGNGAGKTTTAGIEANWWLQCKHPYQDTPQRAVQVWWICQKFQQWEELREQIERRCLTKGWEWNDNKKKYTWPNGSTLTIFSGDGDWAGMQGPNPDLVIPDEECAPEMWTELAMRRRGDKKTRYVIAATATKGKRWMYHDIYKPWLDYHVAKGLDETQAIRQQLHPDYWVWPRGGIMDNPANSAEDERWYQTSLAHKSPQERQARLRGGFVDLNQSPVFDLEALDVIEAMMKAANQPGAQGTLLPLPDVRREGDLPMRFQFVPHGGLHEGGRITIYEPPGEHEYVMGADFAHGLATGDFDGAQVFRKQGEDDIVQVAEAHGRWGTLAFGWVLRTLGLYYNEALLVGEANSMGLSVLQRLYTEFDYVHQYFREAKQDAKHSAKTDRLGFWKGADGKVIGRLAFYISPFDTSTGKRSAPMIHIRSPQLLDEMRHYERRPRNKTAELLGTHDKDLVMGAESGYHDDLVSACAAAVTGVWELSDFRKPPKVFEAGTFGQILGHAAVLNPVKKKSPFSMARSR